MQKLIWQNANNEQIDLTSGNYGIVEWQGFSNADLNIQSQQVPFQDGGVFLDALIEARELSVTLAMQDNNNLEKRYRMRRELIHALNPKLGEGYLIYTNNFISKRIKCVAQIPLFETHNSNDSGTPKASLAWTACNPDWEDLEENIVFLKSGERKQIEYSGDVPTGLIIDLFTNNVTNPQFKSFTENKLIKLNGNFQNTININTNEGQKQITIENMNFNLSNINADLTSVIYIDSLGMIIAVGGKTILTSTDGETWTLRASGNNSLYCITYSKHLGLIVAGGGNKISTSVDGKVWNTITVQGIVINSIVYSETLEMFVAVGGTGEEPFNGKIATSTDGINWNILATDLGERTTLNTIAFSEKLGMFIAFEEVYESHNYITSTDGINWTTRTFPVPNQVWGVSYFEELEMFVAVGDAIIYTSTDGINWVSRISDFSSFTFLNVIYANGLFVTVGPQIILISTDGINWTSPYYNATDQFRSVTYSGGLGYFIAVGDKGLRMYSSDGESWIKPFNSITGNMLNKIIYVESKKAYYAIGNSPYDTIITSTDGINWQNKNSNTGKFLYSICYSELLKLFVITGSQGEIITSTDGNVWTHRASGTNADLMGAIYIKQIRKFIVVGKSGTILTSADGINWQSQSSGVSYVLKGIVYSDRLEKLVVVGDMGTILTSTDGINWQSQAWSGNQEFQSITYSESIGLFVIVGGYFSPTRGYILTSTDGINWTSTNSDFYLYSIIYSDSMGMFVGVGIDGAVYTSTDGMNWTSINVETDNSLYGVCCPEKQKQIVIVGYSGVIFTSYFNLTENIISNISENSDMSITLEIGQNEVLISKESGNLNGRISYRQKYIGV